MSTKIKTDKATKTDNVCPLVISDSTMCNEGVKSRFSDFSSAEDEQMTGTKWLLKEIVN